MGKDFIVRPNLSTEVNMKRRDFLKYTSLFTAGSLYPNVFAQNTIQGINGRRLILVELKGGNDGLNTLVPFKNKDYKRVRKNLHLGANEVYSIDKRLGLGLNKNLSFLTSQFKSRELAVFHSVGYNNPNKSHFRSIDIWDTAVESNESSTKGWISKALESNIGEDAASKGIILGDNNLGPLRGTSQKILVVDNLSQMLRSQKLFDEHDLKGNGALEHVISVEGQVLEQLKSLTGKVDFGNSKGKGLIKNVNTLLQLVKADPKIPFYKLTHGGFDTHINQKQRHGNLLKAFDDGMKALVNGLKELGQYDNTLILTYSEFGRRPMENGSGGTDHGTANCHFAMGGKVKGKIYHGPNGRGKGGKNGLGGYNLASIKSTNENLTHRIDFKSIYQTVLDKWWGLAEPNRPIPMSSKQLNPIDFLKV